MKDLFVIFIGSGLGGISRFALARWVNSSHNHYFPFGTLAVNIVACFLLGFIIGLADHKQMLSPTGKLFLMVGFCGGFSTFSAFSSETLNLLQQGHPLSSVLYVLGSLVLCVTVTFGGHFIAARI